MTKTSGFTGPEVQAALSILLANLIEVLTKKGVLNGPEVVMGAIENARKFDNPINQAAADYLQHIILTAANPKSS